MRFSNRVLFLLMVIFSSLGVQAFAEQHWRVVVPFQFEAKGRTFPAGTYDIAVNPSHGFVTLSSYQNPSKRLEWIAMPSDGRYQFASLKFGEDGINYTLIAVNAGSWATPYRRDDASKYPLTASIYDTDHTNLTASGRGGQ